MSNHFPHPPDGDGGPSSQGHGPPISQATSDAFNQLSPEEQGRITRIWKDHPQLSLELILLLPEPTLKSMDEEQKRILMHFHTMQPQLSPFTIVASFMKPPVPLNIDPASNKTRPKRESICKISVDDDEFHYLDRSRGNRVYISCDDRVYIAPTQSEVDPYYAYKPISRARKRFTYPELSTRTDNAKAYFKTLNSERFLHFLDKEGKPVFSDLFSLQDKSGGHTCLYTDPKTEECFQISWYDFGGMEDKYPDDEQASLAGKMRKVLMEDRISIETSNQPPRPETPHVVPSAPTPTPHEMHHAAAPMTPSQNNANSYRCNTISPAPLASQPPMTPQDTIFTMIHGNAQGIQGVTQNMNSLSIVLKETFAGVDRRFQNVEGTQIQHGEKIAAVEGTQIQHGVQLATMRGELDEMKDLFQSNLIPTPASRRKRPVPPSTPPAPEMPTIPRALFGTPVGAAQPQASMGTNGNMPNTSAAKRRRVASSQSVPLVSVPATTQAAAFPFSPATAPPQASGLGTNLSDQGSGHLATVSEHAPFQAPAKDVAAKAAAFPKVDEVPQPPGNENVLFEACAYRIKRVEGEWEKAKGLLRLYEVASNFRMVLRDDSSECRRVLMNVGVPKGMKFTFSEKKEYVMFCAVENESVGFQSFGLKVNSKRMDELLETLEGMAA